MKTLNESAQAKYINENNSSSCFFFPINILEFCES